MKFPLNNTLKSLQLKTNTFVNDTLKAIDYKINIYKKDK